MPTMPSRLVSRPDVATFSGRGKPRKTILWRSPAPTEKRSCLCIPARLRHSVNTAVPIPRGDCSCQGESYYTTQKNIDFCQGYLLPRMPNRVMSHDAPRNPTQPQPHHSRARTAAYSHVRTPSRTTRPAPQTPRQTPQLLPRTTPSRAEGEEKKAKRRQRGERAEKLGECNEKKEASHDQVRERGERAEKLGECNEATKRESRPGARTRRASGEAGRV